MASIKESFQNTVQNLTITLASLANGSARQSNVVDNSSDGFLDVLISFNMKTAASSTSATGYVNIYAFGTTDGGANYTENAGASDAAITLVSPTNLKFIGQANLVANSTTYKMGPFSLAAAFGGQVPQKWGVVVQNNTGAALDATEGSHVKTYQGIYSSVV